MTPRIVSHLETPVPGAERRRHERHALSCQCWLEADELTICGPTADVGVGGLFVRTGVPFATGSVVEVFMKVTGFADSATDSLSAVARVTRAIPARTGTRHGVGVEFLEIRRGEHTLSKWLTQHVALPWT